MSSSVRRVVTSHNADGEAIFHSDNSFTPELIPGGDASMSTIWTTVNVPANLNDLKDGRERDAGTTLKGGSVIRICDILPNSKSPMHRTNSIDYGIVISGNIELELDDGVCKIMGPGDIIVQQGTIHLWRNPSETEVCRLVFVLIEASPFIHNDKALSEINQESE